MEPLLAGRNKGAIERMRLMTGSRPWLFFELFHIYLQFVGQSFKASYTRIQQLPCAFGVVDIVSKLRLKYWSDNARL